MFVATVNQLKKYDQKLVEEYGYSIIDLVDKASDVLLKHFLDLDNILILCGPGNNGADGLALAGKLTQLNKSVTVYMLSKISSLNDVNYHYCDLIKDKVDLNFMSDDNIHDLIEKIKDFDVIVDAMFGVGLNKNPTGYYQRAILEVNSLFDKQVISIDIPTGLNGDVMKPYLSTICATKTISLTAYKQSFLNEECYIYTGKIIVETLDVENIFEEVGLARMVNSDWVQYHLKARKFDGHKGDYGKILHITGSSSYHGASMLAAKASVYSGSGIVSVCTVDEVKQDVSLFVPECTFLSRKNLKNKELINNYDALLIGPGLGLEKDAVSYVEYVLKNYEKTIVIDADALTIISKNMDLLNSSKANIVLTPHFGEFKRFNQDFDDSSIVEVAKKFAEDYNLMLVLKGPNTILSNGKEIYRNTTANKAMSTAGMGDVLAGVITSFIGQGYDVSDACIIGTYIHGLCGDELAKSDYTVIPSNLVKMIPTQMLKIIKETKNHIK